LTPPPVREPPTVGHHQLRISHGSLEPGRIDEGPGQVHDGRIVAARTVHASRRSGLGVTPMPGPVGTAMVPSGSRTKGSVMSSWKYRSLALVSPGKAAPGIVASARFAARPTPVSSMPPIQ